MSHDSLEQPRFCEPARRVHGTVEVPLLWDRQTGQATVVVWNWQSGSCLQVNTEPAERGVRLRAPLCLRRRTRRTRKRRPSSGVRGPRPPTVSGYAGRFPADESFPQTCTGQTVPGSRSRHLLLADGVPVEVVPGRNAGQSTGAPNHRGSWPSRSV